MVCRSMFVWSIPRNSFYPEKFPSLTTMATRVLKKALWDAISCISAMLSLWNLHSRVSGGAYMKDGYHYSVSYMFSESLCSHISFAH